VSAKHFDFGGKRGKSKGERNQIEMEKQSDT